MIIAGFGSSVAFITSVATVAKNFSRDLSILFVAVLITYQKTAEAFDDSIHAAFFPEGKDRIYFIVMGLLVTIVYGLGSLGLTSKKEGVEDNPELAVADKAGALIFVGTVGLYMLLLWIFERLLGIETAAIVIVLVFVFINFGVAFIVVWMAKMPNFKSSAKQNQPHRQADTDSKNLGQMFKDPKYICLLFIFLFISGCCFQYVKRLPKLAVEAQAGTAIKLTKNLEWIFDVLGRLLGGVLAFSMYSTGKDSMYNFVTGFVGSFLIGTFSVFMILTVNVDGTFFLYLVAIFLGLAEGGAWVTIAQTIIDDGGLKNFGLNWGTAVFFNYLGIFSIDLLVQFIEFKVATGVIYLVLGVIAIGLAIFALIRDINERK